VSVVIVGAGEVGYHVAERLSNEGHQVVVVDLEADRLDYVQSHLDVGVIEGNGASPSVLERAGIANATLFVAVTSVDEVNLVGCTAARGRPDMTRVARISISNPDFYTEAARLRPERFAVDVMINPERELALDTLQLLQSTVATDIAAFAGGKLQLISLQVTEDAPIADRTLANITAELGNFPLLTAAIERDGRTLVPDGSTVVRAGDHVYVVATVDAVKKAIELAGHQHTELTRVMIAGGSREAFYLGQFLQEHKVSATLLVHDRPRAQELAERLPKALILNGDATDVELLEVEGVGDMDAFVALTDEDQTNILSSLVAKHAGAKQVVTLVNKLEYVSLARAIGLDAAVSPRLSAANAILRQVRRGSVTRVATFKSTDAEAISFTVSASSPLVGKSLMGVEFPEGTIVAAILRGDAVIVPRGHDQLKTGDTAIVFALQEAVNSVTKLFPT
jgi:trk system potassium uptake protein TrkA